MSHVLPNLASQRASASHSVDTLAKKANVSDHTIIRLENGGFVGVDASNRIADALGVSLTTLGKDDR